MASVNGYGEFDEGRPRRRRWPWLLVLLLLVFLGGGVGAGWLIVRDPRIAARLGLVSATQARAQAALAEKIAVAPPPRPTPAAPRAAGDPALAARVAALSAQVAGLESQTRAATGDASRAEGLLVAFAARRALDRGLQLGYIEGLLRERFGQDQPDAVAAVLSAARTPVTLADLRNGLDAVAPALIAGGGERSGAGWWQSFRREIAGLVVIRRADQPSSLPADRVARAERMLEAGQVDGALAEVLRLPDRAIAAQWVAAARRYLAGRGALDRIETAALIAPQPPAPVAAPWPAAAVPGVALPPTAVPPPESVRVD